MVSAPDGPGVVAPGRVRAAIGHVRPESRAITLRLTARWLARGARAARRRSPAAAWPRPGAWSRSPTRRRRRAARPRLRRAGPRAAELERRAARARAAVFGGLATRDAPAAGSARPTCAGSSRRRCRSTCPAASALLVAREAPRPALGDATAPAHRPPSGQSDGGFVSDAFALTRRRLRRATPRGRTVNARGDAIVALDGRATRRGGRVAASAPRCARPRSLARARGRPRAATVRSRVDAIRRGCRLLARNGRVALGQHRPPCGVGRRRGAGAATLERRCGPRRGSRARRCCLRQPRRDVRRLDRPHAQRPARGEFARVGPGGRAGRSCSRASAARCSTTRPPDPRGALAITYTAPRPTAAGRCSARRSPPCAAAASRVRPCDRLTPATSSPPRAAASRSSR